MIETENSEVTEKVTDLLINLYNSLSENIQEKVKEIIEECVDTSMARIKQTQEDQNIDGEERVRRLNRLLNFLIRFIGQSEENGTAGLRQQRSLMKGQLLDKIQVTQNVTQNKKFCKRFTVALYSNTTVWDLRNIVAALS